MSKDEEGAGVRAECSLEWGRGPVESCVPEAC